MQPRGNGSPVGDRARQRRDPEEEGESQGRYRWALVTGGRRQRRSSRRVETGGSQEGTGRGLQGRFGWASGSSFCFLEVKSQTKGSLPSPPLPVPPPPPAQSSPLRTPTAASPLSRRPPSSCLLGSAAATAPRASLPCHCLQEREMEVAAGDGGGDGEARRRRRKLGSLVEAIKSSERIPKNFTRMEKGELYMMWSFSTLGIGDCQDCMHLCASHMGQHLGCTDLASLEAGKWSMTC
ncbi:hypothetical protein GUJ93_ZPchr0002g25723 [Zizania palustris]|uniref:Uncharacterized protein n=1 Tax=Zizania palustris TaxID=103762 RepID=A0A8J5S8V1_ZIZPA|nr:hypothetical protein GUJ93_ZPchr0002g25723 [Zizania palustris]